MRFKNNGFVSFLVINNLINNDIISVNSISDFTDEKELRTVLHVSPSLQINIPTHVYVSISIKI